MLHFNTKWEASHSMRRRHLSTQGGTLNPTLNFNLLNVSITFLSIIFLVLFLWKKQKEPNSSAYTIVNWQLLFSRQLYCSTLPQGFILLYLEWCYFELQVWWGYQMQQDLVFMFHEGNWHLTLKKFKVLYMKNHVADYFYRQATNLWRSLLIRNFIKWNFASSS